MRKFISIVLMAVLLASALVGCTLKADKASTGSAESADKINIVATIFPPYDFARAIAGDKADLTMLINPGAEIHSYDPSPTDIIKIQNADVFIYVGGESDAWVDAILSSMDTSQKRIIRLMDSISLVEEEIVEGMEDEHHHDDGENHDEAEDRHDDGDNHDEAGAGHEEEVEYDEHVWTSPKNAVLIINDMAAALCAIDPENADIYKQNAVAYTDQIVALDGELRAIVANAPHKLLVFGDRFPFRYFADAYGLEYRAAFPGCSTETEASAATIAYLINTVKAQQIPYVYTIEFSNQNIARSIAEQTDAGVLLLHSCHNVSKQDFEAGVTYFSLMKQNAENLRKGLN